MFKASFFCSIPCRELLDHNHLATLWCLGPRHNFIIDVMRQSMEKSYYCMRTVWNSGQEFADSCLFPPLHESRSRSWKRLGKHFSAKLFKRIILRYFITLIHSSGTQESGQYWMQEPWCEARNVIQFPGNVNLYWKMWQTLQTQLKSCD